MYSLSGHSSRIFPLCESHHGQHSTFLMHPSISNYIHNATPSHNKGSDPSLEDGASKLEIPHNLLLRLRLLIHPSNQRPCRARRTHHPSKWHSRRNRGSSRPLLGHWRLHRCRFTLRKWLSIRCLPHNRSSGVQIHHQTNRGSNVGVAGVAGRKHTMRFFARVTDVPVGDV